MREARERANPSDRSIAPSLPNQRRTLSMPATPVAYPACCCGCWAPPEDPEALAAARNCGLGGRREERRGERREVGRRSRARTEGAPSPPARCEGNEERVTYAWLLRLRGGRRAGTEEQGPRGDLLLPRVCSSSLPGAAEPASASCWVSTVRKGRSCVTEATPSFRVGWKFWRERRVGGRGRRREGLGGRGEGRELSSLSCSSRHETVAGVGALWMCLAAEPGGRVGELASVVWKWGEWGEEGGRARA